MEQTFVMISGLPNLGKSDWAKSYNNATIISEKEEYEALKAERINLKNNLYCTDNIENIVDNELKEEYKNTRSYITSVINTKVRTALERGDQTVLLIFQGLNFRERGYVMNNISDIKCIKNLIFFYKGINTYKKHNEIQDNKLTDKEIDLLFSDFDMPDNNYTEGFNHVFLM